MATKRAKNGLNVADSVGCIPLHLAASRHVGAENMEFLVTRYPGGVQSIAFHGLLPLHIVCADTCNDSLRKCRLLLESDGGLWTMILQTCETGWTPLQLAYFTNPDNPLPLEAREYLLEKQDDAVRLLNPASCGAAQTARCTCERNL